MPADSPESSNAYLTLQALLKEYGLESLAPEVLKFLQDGYSQEQVSFLIQDTDAYRKRFAGNELRRNAGVPVLSPAEYLETERSYRQIMETAGLPAGFYDSPDDFAKWIGGDVAPTEVQNRVNLAVDAAERMNPANKLAFQEYYGIQSKDLAAYFLDQQRALPLLERQARAVTIGGASGLSINKERAERLATSDLSDRELVSATGRVGTLARDIGKLSGLYGGQYGQTQAEEEVFFDNEEARRRRQQLSSREAGEFNAGSGATSRGLSQGSGNF